MSEDLRLANRLLAAVPESEWALLQSSVEVIQLEYGRTLVQAGAELPRVYFPIRGAISALTVTSEGGSVEALLAGNEGAMGVAAAWGFPTSPWRLAVQGDGEALAFEPETLAEALPRAPEAVRLLFRYSHALQQLGTQSVACNRFHELPERTARWLLMMLDRVGGDEVIITQDFLAQMLGVHRPSTTIALAVLRQAGLIRRGGRGRIIVLDRPGLEDAACECYSLIRAALDKVVGPGPVGADTRGPAGL